jgi:biotin carboxyl carrier protein
MNLMDNNEKLEQLNINSSLYTTHLSTKFKNRVSYKPADPKLVLSFIPGTVVEIFAQQGQKVTKGEVLMILDAMKMQNKLKCPIDGKIKAITAKKGDRVSKGTLLIELE